MDNKLFFSHAVIISHGIDWRALAEEQLAEWGVRYQTLIMGKPNADLFIDNKAIRADAYSW
jgi:hypothetical protein